MPRKPDINYFASRGAYYTQLAGVQHKLATGPDDKPAGPTYEAARQAYLQLLQLAAVPQARDQSPVRAVVEWYLRHVEEARSASTLALRKHGLVPFTVTFGDRRVADLTHDDVDLFVRRMRAKRPHGRHEGIYTRWSVSTVAIFLKSLNAAFNWAVKRKLIDSNPLAGYEIPQTRSRSVRCLISPADHQRVLAHIGQKPLRNLIVALEASGARPGELYGATARDWDGRLGAIVYHGDDTRREDEYRHKTAGLGKDRIIRFHGDALAMMRRLAEKYPTGPLLRNRQGRAWRHKFVSTYFRRIRAVLKMPDFIPYGYRHTFATRWLEAGRSIDLLAEIMGNTPETIRKHYRHIDPRSSSVDAAFHDFFGGGT